MEVSCIETEKFLMFDRVTHVKFVGSNDVAFAADSEEFAFDRVEMVFWIDFLREDLIE